MRRTLIFIFSILFLNICLTAQNYKPVTVKAGTRVTDYFPVEERFRYPQFTEGKCNLINGTVIPGRFNYNFLSGEMEFIKLTDTLSISNKEDISFITIVQDTFYYHNGYMEMIRSGLFRVFLKREILIKDILRKGAFGVVNRGSSFESYRGAGSTRLSYNSIKDEDMVLQNETTYYFSTPVKDYNKFTRENIIHILPGKEDIVKNHLRSKKIDFKSRDDLLQLADFLNNLLSDR